MPGTNLTFDASVPAANDDPSIDQPDMLANNVSTNAWVTQDHYGFNTTGSTNNFGGLHQQVSFPATNIPGGYTIPTIYRNNDNLSHAQFYLATTSAAASTDQYQVTNSGTGTNGSVLLFNGIIIKWFSISATVGSHSYTFASLGLNDFPNNLLNAVVSSQSNGAQAAYLPGSSDKTKIQINALGTNIVSVIAIGN